MAASLLDVSTCAHPSNDEGSITGSCCLFLCLFATLCLSFASNGNVYQPCFAKGDWFVQECYQIVAKMMAITCWEVSRALCHFLGNVGVENPDCFCFAWL